MLKINQPLILGRGLPFPLNFNLLLIARDNAAFLNALVPALGVLPVNPPFELHPYKGAFHLQNFDKYIIGTFPPISYVLDKPQVIAAGIITLQHPMGAACNPVTTPRIPFYHGNQRSMWGFLLANAQNAVLDAILQGANGRQNAKTFLINFLVNSEINYADIIDSTQRIRNANGCYDGQDKNLNNICPNNDLIHHILANPKAKYLMFNTASIFSNAGIRLGINGLINVDANTKAFDLFVRQCQDLGLIVQIQIQAGNAATFYPWTNIAALTLAQRRTKIAFEMKIKNPIGNKKLVCDFGEGKEKIFTVVTPFSPAAVNRGRIKTNRIVHTWRLNNGMLSPNVLLTSVYQNFRNINLLPIFNLNV